MLHTCLLFALALAACGDGVEYARPSNGVLKMEVSLGAFHPRRIASDVGQSFRLELTSLDSSHAFVVPDLGVDDEVGPGQTQSIQMPATRTGTFEFHCRLPGHREQGEEGEYSVTRPAPVATGSSGSGVSSPTY